MFDKNLNKVLEIVKINLSEILTAEKNHITDTLYDGNISCHNIQSYKVIKIKSNNKNYIITTDKIINNYHRIEIELVGDENGNLIVINNQKYKCNASREGKGNGHCIVSGSGDGSAKRVGKGNGNAIISGNGYGNASRMDKGNGHSIRIGSGDGNASRYDEGHGHAIKLGSGDGSTWVSGKGHGHAVKLGSGDGNSWNKEAGSGYAIKIGSGKGDTIKDINI